jgi:hypothetical protein
LTARLNNASEQAIKGPKRHQAVCGYWHSLATLARYCRVRSYLVTSRNHGIRPIDAIHAALTWRPGCLPRSAPELRPVALVNGSGFPMALFSTLCGNRAG